MRNFKIWIIGLVLALSLSAFTVYFINNSKQEKVLSEANSTDSNEISKKPSISEISPTKISKTKTIVAFGDSLTAGFGLQVPQAEAYPALLQKKINENNLDYTVINSGISGETSESGLRRIDSIIQIKPEIVILELGANDALRNLSPKTAFDNLSQIIEKLQAANIRIFLAQIEAPNLSPTQTEYFAKYKDIYPQLSAKYNVILISSFLNNVLGVPKLNLSDGYHPNPDGYKIIVNENIWPFIEAELRAAD